MSASLTIYLHIRVSGVGAQPRPGSASAEAPWLGAHEPEPFAAYAFFERNVLTAFPMRSP